MKYLTRGWQNGELTDDQSNAAVQAYRDRIKSIRERLDPDILALAEEVQLHDAIIEKVSWRSKIRELTITFAAIYSPESDYKTVAITYHNALLGDSRVETLRLVANDRRTELTCSEVDLDDDGNPVHRMLFEPRDEVTIDCSSITLRVSPRSDRRVYLIPAFLEDHE